MTTQTLRLHKGHLFTRLSDGRLALVDTGAAQSMGDSGSVTLAGLTVPTTRRYLAATLKKLRQYVGVPFDVLLGQDVLLRLDAVYDLPNGAATFSQNPDLALEGATVNLRRNGVPTLTGWVRGRPELVGWDSGAQLSYFTPREDDQSVLPYAGKAEDFFPLVGRYTVDTYRVPVTLGESNVTMRVRAAVAPGVLRRMLGQWGVLMGSELVVGRQVGFFPLRGELTVGGPKDG